VVSFNYSIFIDKVIKLKQWSQSAGSYFDINNFRTSETLRNETVQYVCLENVKEISVHVPRHLKPISENQFGHYLAGLVDGSGMFNTKQELIIEFHHLDASLAYYIKKRIGYGSVKIKKFTKSGNLNKNTDNILYILSSKEGIKKAINFINNKIRNEKILDQINNNVLNNDNYIEFKNSLNNNLNLNLDNDLQNKNHWLAGFSDATASFHINFETDKLNENNCEIKLNFKITHNSNSLLLLIKDFLGGNISYDKNQDMYIYDSSSYGSAKNVINYLDYYHLLSTKQVNYLKWRKSYIIVQNKDLTNKTAIDKIMKYKKTMNR
jgi:hypothetical protein